MKIVKELVEIWPNKICDREEEFEVEKILNKRIVWGKEKFLVR